MAKGAIYIHFATKLLAFFEEHDFNPVSFVNDLKVHMRKEAPSVSTVYMALRGQRLLPMPVILFMQQRYGFKCTWKHTLPIQNKSGARLKDSQLVLEGWGK